MTAPTKQPRLLIFVIAYYAESTLRWVLERIPASVFQTYDCEVLVTTVQNALLGTRLSEFHSGVTTTTCSCNGFRIKELRGVPAPSPRCSAMACPARRPSAPTSPSSA